MSCLNIGQNNKDMNHAIHDFPRERGPFRKFATKIVSNCRQSAVKNYRLTCSGLIVVIIGRAVGNHKNGKGKTQNWKGLLRCCLTWLATDASMETYVALSNNNDCCTLVRCGPSIGRHYMISTPNQWDRCSNWTWHFSFWNATARHVAIALACIWHGVGPGCSFL